MPWVHSRFLIVVGCLGTCALHSGCGKSHGWGVSGGPESNCWVEHLRCDGRAFMVLVANGGSKGTSSGEGNGSYHGELLTMDGCKISWSCSTSDATRGTVTIDGQKFELGEGSVFLVRTKESMTKVEQLSIEAPKLQFTNIQTLGSADPRIAQFFKESEAKP